MIAILLAFSSSPCSGSVLDWDSVTWTDGSTAAQVITVDGVDVTFTWSGSVGSFTGTAPSNGNAITGGDASAPNSLQWFVDFGSVADSITLTVSFSSEVTGVSFDIFNVDAANLFGFGTYQDEVIVTADGGTIDPTITTSANNSQIGANGVEGNIGVITGGTALTSGDANASFSFGSENFSEFSITFSSGASGFLGVSPQAIALHDITFAAIPEAETYWAGAGLLGLAVLIGLRRKRRKA